MMFKAAIAALALALAACGALYVKIGWQADTIEALRDENDDLRLSLDGCTARAANQHEDDKSDAQVDAMPDLRRVPDGWLLPPAPGSGGVY